MDRPQLLKRLDALLTEAERTHQWGTIQIDLQFGKPVLIRETRNTKLSEGNAREQYEKFERR
jgi:hypothetical protein